MASPAGLPKSLGPTGPAAAAKSKKAAAKGDANGGGTSDSAANTQNRPPWLVAAAVAVLAAGVLVPPFLARRKQAKLAELWTEDGSAAVLVPLGAAAGACSPAWCESAAGGDCSQASGDSAELGARLVISTHQALLALDVGTGDIERLHHAGGHYYGVSSASLVGLATPALLVGSQQFLAHYSVRNISRLPEMDTLLLIEPRTRCALGAWALRTDFLHDGIYDPVSGDLHVLDATEGLVHRAYFEHTNLTVEPRSDETLSAPVVSIGSILRTRTPYPVARNPRLAHANSMAIAAGCVWVMHHNREEISQLLVIDVTSMELRAVFSLGGSSCHNPVFYRGSVLYLDSNNGGLSRLVADGTSTSLWSAGKKYFTKGLAVVDDVAYFGVSVKTTYPPQRNWVNCGVVAYDLKLEKLMWRRAMPFPGLINAINAPGVDNTCSWRACASKSGELSAAELHNPLASEWFSPTGNVSYERCVAANYCGKKGGRIWVHRDPEGKLDLPEDSKPEPISSTK